MKTAEQEYMRITENIEAELNNLEERLEAHFSRFSNDSGDWGKVGDLSHILHELKLLNTFLEN